MWLVQAQVETREAGPGSEWSGSRQVPTFFLDRGDGTREGAERTARRVLNPAGLIPDDRIHVSIVGTNRGDRP